MASTVAYIGLIFYVIIFVLILARNFKAHARERESKRKSWLTYLTDCIYDEHNPAFFVAVLICITSILCSFLYVAFGAGLIFNVLQQGVFASWQLSLFRHFAFIFDPFQRIIDQSNMSFICFWLHASLGLVCLAMTMLIWVDIVPRVYGNVTIVNLFFMGISALIVFINLQASRYFLGYYLCCRRGLQSQIKQGPPNVTEQKLHLTVLANIKNVTVGGKVDLSQMLPDVDKGCIRSLVMQKVLLERLLGLCAIGLMFNVYKMIWSAGLVTCFYHTHCGTENYVDNLSYWLPDFAGFLYWFIFLLNPLNVYLKSSAEKRHTQMSGASRDMQLRDSKGCVSSNDSINLGYIFDRKSDPSIEMFGAKNPLNTDAGTADISQPNLRDLKRLSKKNKQRSVKNLFGGSSYAEIESQSAKSTQLKNLSSESDCRELHLSLREMVLVDKRVGVPVPSLFAGRDTFVVMSVTGWDGERTVKKKRSSGVIERLSERMRTASRASKLMLRGVQNDEIPENPDASWREMARSDCRLNEANPDFIVSFIVPVIENSADKPEVQWRFDIYNANTDDPTFRSELADLEEQKLVGVLYLSNGELEGRARQLSWQQDASDSDDEEEALPRASITNTPDGTRCIQKGIFVGRYGDNFVRLGGVGIISTRTISPFSQLITELGVVNSMRHPSSNMRQSSITANDVSAVSEFVSRDSSRQKNLSSENSQSVVTTTNPSSAESEENSDEPSHEVLMRAFSFSARVDKSRDKTREIRVVEEMVESPYSFQVPLAFMKCLLVERYMEMDVLMNRFGLHDVPIDYEGDDWQMEIIATLQKNLMDLKESMRTYDNSTSTFKSSAKKSDFGLRYIPINLHMHVMTMAGTELKINKETGDIGLADFESSYICDFMTVGAFAAHTKKFKSGGLWHIMKNFDARLEKVTEGSVPAPDDFRMPDEVWNVESLKDLPPEKRLFNLALAARERLDITLAQCLSAVATGFVSRLQLMSPDSLERIATVGLLFQFESLLSTQGSELGMLSDMYCTIRTLNRVHIKIHEHKETSMRSGRRHSISGPEAQCSVYWGMTEGFADQCLIVDMGFFPDWFKKLPQIIKDGKSIPVVPVMFSVGINELQSYAETMNGKKASALQDIINKENLERIKNYCSLVLRLEHGEFDESSADMIARSSTFSESGGADSGHTRSYVPSFKLEENQQLPRLSTLHDKDDSDAELSDEEDKGTASGNDGTDSGATQPNVDREVSGISPVSSPLPKSTSSDDDGNMSLAATGGSSPENTDTLRESVLEKANDYDAMRIGRRRQTINQTSTAMALNGAGNRRRLSSVMRPSLLTPQSSFETMTSVAESPPRMSSSHDQSVLKSASSEEAESKDSSALASETNLTSTRPAPMVKKSSNMKIWDVIEDDSDDESLEDMEEVVTKSHVFPNRKASFGSSNDKIEESNTTINAIRRSSAVENRQTAAIDDVLDDDLEDGILAADIERAIQDAQNREMDDVTTKSSLSNFVTSVKNIRQSNGDKRETESSSSPISRFSSSVNSQHPSSEPRRRQTGIAHRLMSFVSNPKTSGTGGRHLSSEDPSGVFDDDDDLTGIDVEMGFGNSSYQRDSLAARSVNTVGVGQSPSKGAKSSSVVADTGNSSYLKDCLEIRESSIISPGGSAHLAMGTPMKSGDEESMSNFEWRIRRLLSQLDTVVTRSIGAGGKPYQILTTAAKLTRALDGVRSTSCKSAKDRTGMSVTLEEASLVKDVFHINAHETKDLLDTLRVHGLRLENAKKNVGKPSFAFNSIQRRFLPRAYAPPLSVLGNVSS